MNKERFLELCDSSYSHIPVYEEFVADLISPLYVFSNYFNLKNTFLFESAKSHEVKGRYSIMSLQSLKRYNFFNNEVEIITKEGCFFCDLAKYFLKENKIQFHEIQTKVKSYPQLIINDECIGGFHELWKNYLCPVFNFAFFTKSTDCPNIFLISEILYPSSLSLLTLS